MMVEVRLQNAESSHLCFKSSQFRMIGQNVECAAFRSLLVPNFVISFAYGCTDSTTS